MDAPVPVDPEALPDLDAVASAAPGADAGDDATPICLRCFAPLEGAPTNCPNCGAGASRSSMLGPSVAGGVDVGLGATGPWLERPRPRLTVWTYLLVWILGMLFIPPLTDFGRSRAVGFWGSYRFQSRVQLPVVVGWTLIFGWLLLREAKRAPKQGESGVDGSDANTPPP